MGHEIKELEQNLVDLNAKCVLLTISDDIVKERILSRDAAFWKEKSNDDLLKACQEFIETQNQLREQAKLSKVPMLEINTDARDWDTYAKKIIEYTDVI
ncbi:hypothetical protein ACFQ3W_09945 [Paenibacillus puldeungensis]|uniref:Uncharacterized protein n=1 Tax=Paenibacillus puldeungensis TaxID=696536 RepID=A0ABW3RW38_9BACL